MQGFRGPTTIRFSYWADYNHIRLIPCLFNRVKSVVLRRFIAVYGIGSELPYWNCPFASSSSGEAKSRINKPRLGTFSISNPVLYLSKVGACWFIKSDSLSYTVVSLLSESMNDTAASPDPGFVTASKRSPRPKFQSVAGGPCTVKDRQPSKQRLRLGNPSHQASVSSSQNMHYTTVHLCRRCNQDKFRYGWKTSSKYQSTYATNETGESCRIIIAQPPHDQENVTWSSCSTLCITNLRFPNELECR